MATLMDLMTLDCSHVRLIALIVSAYKAVESPREHIPRLCVGARYRSL